MGEVQGGFAGSSEILIGEADFLRQNTARIEHEMFLRRFGNWRVSLLGMAVLSWAIGGLYYYLAPQAGTLYWAGLNTVLFAAVGLICVMYERRGAATAGPSAQQRWLLAWTVISASAGALTGALPWFLPAARIDLQLSAGIIVSIITFVFVASRATRQLIYATVLTYSLALCLALALHAGAWWAVPLCLAYSGVVVGVVLALNRSMHAAIGGQLYAQYLHGELRRSHARQLQVQQRETALNERQRMMADLNDGLGAQMLAALRRLEGGKIDALGAAAALRECVDDLQLTVDAHEPAARNLATLLGMLRNRLQPRLQAAGLRLEWRAFDLPPGATLAAPQSLDLLRILLQAVDNALQHAGAHEVVVTTTRMPRQFEIAVEDDGRGFDPAAALREGRGIASMQRRAARLGAELLIEPREGRGSVLRLRLKLPLGR